MAFVKKRRIDAKECQLSSSSLSNDQSGGQQDEPIKSISCQYKSFTKIKSKVKDCKLLSDSKWMEKFLRGEIESSHYVSENSYNVADFISSRSIDNKGQRLSRLPQVFGTRRLISHNLLREKNYECNSLNKIFSSQWLNDQQVVFGTKCNKLIVLDTTNQKQHLIPTLKSLNSEMVPENMCGIHAIEINPSRTLLATGGHNPNDVSIYRLPTLDPVFIGEKAHTDWIFDMTWLDDQFLISGSRDSTLALWRFNAIDNTIANISETSLPKYRHIQPLQTKLCDKAEKIRALLFNKKSEDVAVLSLNAFIHLFDSKTFTQKLTRQLPFCLENVCLSQQNDRNLYAVGSKSHVSLLDANTLEPIHRINSKNQGSGIRSLSFNDELLTIGTGAGTVLFYDVRAMDYLEYGTSNSSENYSYLKASKGFVYPEELFSDIFLQFEYSPAIYTHQYDPSKTRLFVAGGPLPASLQGSYAALWS